MTSYHCLRAQFSAPLRVLYALKRVQQEPQLVTFQISHRPPTLQISQYIIFFSPFLSPRDTYSISHLGAKSIDNIRCHTSKLSSPYSGRQQFMTVFPLTIILTVQHSLSLRQIAAADKAETMSGAFSEQVVQSLYDLITVMVSIFSTSFSLSGKVIIACIDANCK